MLDFLDKSDIVFLEYYKQFVMYNYINYKKEYENIMGLDFFTLERMYNVLNKILMEANGQNG